VVRGTQANPTVAALHGWLFVAAQVPGSRWYPCPHELLAGPDRTWSCEIVLGGPAGVRHTILVGTADAATSAMLTRYVAEHPNQPVLPDAAEPSLPAGFMPEMRISVERG
jgi:hypothetical protein